MFIVSTLQINPNNSENTLILSVALNHPAVDMVYPASSSSHHIWQTISPLLDRNADARFEMSPKLYSTFIWNLASKANHKTMHHFIFKRNTRSSDPTFLTQHLIVVLKSNALWILKVFNLLVINRLIRLFLESCHWIKSSL